MRLLEAGRYILGGSLRLAVAGEIGWALSAGDLSGSRGMIRTSPSPVSAWTSFWPRCNGVGIGQDPLTPLAPLFGLGSLVQGAFQRVAPAFQASAGGGDCFLDRALGSAVGVRTGHGRGDTPQWPGSSKLGLVVRRDGSADRARRRPAGHALRRPMGCQSPGCKWRQELVDCFEQWGQPFNLGDPGSRMPQGAKGDLAGQQGAHAAQALVPRACQTWLSGS